MSPPIGGGGIINTYLSVTVAGYITMTLMTFDRQSNGRRIEVES